MLLVLTGCVVVSFVTAGFLTEATQFGTLFFLTRAFFYVGAALVGYWLAHLIPAPPRPGAGGKPFCGFGPVRPP